MKNDYLAAQHWIMKHLPNPNRPTIRELEDLLVSYADAVSKPLRAKLAKKAPRQVDPTNIDREIGKHIGR